MMAFLRCTRQVEESTGSTLALQSVRAKTGYTITYPANTFSPSLSSVLSVIGQTSTTFSRQQLTLS